MSIKSYSDKGESLIGSKGELVCDQAFPSMPIYFVDDPKNKKYKQAYFADFDGVVLVLYADTPFVSVDTLAKMVAATQRENVALTVLGFRPEEPGAYGRLKQAENGDLTAIVEAKDASAND